jgi:phage shock protein PspC (stress-responsive transcriptional regulator)
MNTTVTIHLAHILFHIDSDAYDLLKKYLDKLEKSFSKTEGKQEILEDIEVRIAELFSQYSNLEGYVISKQNVKDVIETLGSPEDIADEDFVEENTKSESQKKFYRDSENRIIGGVASGVGYFFGIERVWIRLIIILLILSSVGGIIFIYILLWALIPEATTTAEKLRMKGKPVNISNIEKKIKEGLEGVTDKVKNADYSKTVDSLKNNSAKLSGVLEKIAQVLIKIFTKTIGFFMIFISSIVIICLIFSLAIFGFISLIELPHELLFLSMNSILPLWAFSILTLLGIGIPFVFIFTLGLRMLTSKRKLMGNTTKYTLSVIWITTLLIISFTVANEFRSKAFTAKNSNTERIDIKLEDTLKIRMNRVEYDNEILVFNSTHLIYNDQEELRLLNDDLRLNISESPNQTTELKIEKEAKGFSQKKARSNVDKIDYHHEYFNKNLLLDDKWVTSVSESKNEQKIKLNLTVSNGQYIYIESEFGPYMQRKIKNNQNYSRKKVAGHLWKMDNGVLICQDCIVENKKTVNVDEQFKIKVSNEESNFELKISEEGIEINNVEN